MAQQHAAHLHLAADGQGEGERGRSVKEMRYTHHSLVVLVLSVAALHTALAGEPEDRSRIWEQYAIHAYSNLNTRLNGALTPVFRSLGDFGELQQYFDKDRNPEKYEAYRQFLVQALGDAMRGDVGEAIFENVVLELFDVLAMAGLPARYGPGQPGWDARWRPRWPEGVENETQYGDSPMSEAMADNDLGRFWFLVETPIKLRCKRDCTWSWSGELRVTDVRGGSIPFNPQVRTIRAHLPIAGQGYSGVRGRLHEVR